MILDSLQNFKITNLYKQLIQTIKKRHPDVNEKDLQIIEKAYQLAYEAHKDQKRLSGEPFVIHPLHVALYLADISMDPATIAAGLLHDVIEDTYYNEDFIRKEFGDEITRLVKAVTKISLVKKDSYKENLSEIKAQEAAENLRLMLLATVEDIRVIIIKLADKLHNMQTIQHQLPHKIERISREVLDIYAPIAGRLGMYKLKSELEDLAFEALYPEVAKKIKNEIQQSKSELEGFLKKIKKVLQNRLQEINITAEIEGRVKHLYSIYQKMQKGNKTIREIYDLRGIRIIVKELNDCYTVLGIVHTMWKPLPGRFKDYIALPKPNGYQSLHTTVLAPDGRPLEIQIRTFEMNERAENGIAAHWLYKHNLDFQNAKGKLEWLQTLKQLTQEFQSSAKQGLEHSKEFLDNLKEELQPDEIYVFTPKADIITLPRGATVLDFAFKIHTDLGLRCKSALVNDRIVPLSTELKSGDKVEIITHSEPKPSPIWIKYLKSNRARQKVRAFFRKKEELEKQKEKTETHEKKKEIIIKRKPSKNPKEVPIEIAGGEVDVPVRYAGCCSPVPGDKIIGYITRGKGITIHRVDCQQLPKNNNEVERFISVKWAGLTEVYPVAIEIIAKDRQGLYLDLVKAITQTKTNILKALADLPKEKNGLMKATFLLEVEHIDQLNEVIQSILLIKDVVEAKRKN
ncbi:MAG: bifunctional (p)ppGpp synthetase/guanosine-3',5'-bis(diphosphate) 3'-pyrophosphohydrolase [Leptospiraceae bacterium]|nr:bifunctional (p)ppGpp synthetase/guanosine-3',5'-bis(diphosphate) 3'-pyrophosphohydrolase [Leptospiraceae bacterium]MDW7977105.1 bifunctional (p)ppGpp synthetase/guanosine-3',5'-bis(diphosphate) 3'-pyrophosphohydrolase [Leptospiraceae bacterium]